MSFLTCLVMSRRDVGTDFHTTRRGALSTRVPSVSWQMFVLSFVYTAVSFIPYICSCPSFEDGQQGGLLRLTKRARYSVINVQTSGIVTGHPGLGMSIPGARCLKPGNGNVDNHTALRYWNKKRPPALFKKRVRRPFCPYSESGFHGQNTSL